MLIYIRKVIIEIYLIKKVKIGRCHPDEGQDLSLQQSREKDADIYQHDSKKSLINLTDRKK
jgi:hypothetical protein